ncbi:MAG: DedA family protein [Planctomycetes bacterium]|nr:DedA family protein [Planctomycetota bacterium]
MVRPSRNPLRRIYQWTLSWAEHRFATLALFFVSFIESSVFPIPPDVLQIAMTLVQRRRAYWFACVSTIGSTLGGILGYGIGWYVWSQWDGLRNFFFTYVFKQSTFDMVTRIYKEYDVWFVFIAAFTPIPYKVFTIAGGVCAIAFPSFVAVSLIGRGGRFFLVAAMLWWFGEKVKTLIEKYFEVATLALVALGLGGFYAIKWLNHLVQAWF